MELKNLVLHGKGCHSQTQGKEECFNSSLTRGFLKYSTFENQVDAAQKLSEYRNFYNNKRSASRPESENAVFALFQKPDTFSEKIEALEYSDGFEIGSVKDSRYVSIHNQGYILSEVSGGKQLAIRESSKGGSFINLCFRQCKIAQIDVEKRVFPFCRAYLIDGDPRFMQS